ncbi:MAG: hypothetical protein ACRC46_08335 [Thermoguttaceae bacterium]
MVVRKKQDVLQVLKRKGFELTSCGDHHCLTFYNRENKAILKTKVSHGTSHRDIGDTLIGLMAKQCHLTKREFLELVDCTLSQEAYRDLLVTRIRAGSVSECPKQCPQQSEHEA